MEKAKNSPIEFWEGDFQKPSRPTKKLVSETMKKLGIYLYVYIYFEPA